MIRNITGISFYNSSIKSKPVNSYQTEMLAPLEYDTVSFSSKTPLVYAKGVLKKPVEKSGDMILVTEKGKQYNLGKLNSKIYKEDMKVKIKGEENNEVIGIANQGIPIKNFKIKKI